MEKARGKSGFLLLSAFHLLQMSFQEPIDILGKWTVRLFRPQFRFFQNVFIDGNADFLFQGSILAHLPHLRPMDHILRMVA